MTQTYSIRRGDTLSSLARRFGTSVDVLAKANNIKDTNHIIAGKTLKVPDGFDSKNTQSTNTQSTSQKTQSGDVFETKQQDTQQKTEQQKTEQQSSTSTTTRADNAAWRDEKTNRNFPSRDGVPLYGQGDGEWGKQDLGTGKNNYTIKDAGCAITACSMAVSKMSGKTFTPKEMDNYLDKNQGYSGDSVKFGSVGAAVQSNPPVVSKREYNFSTKDIDKELSAGRPVVIGVDYKNGKGTDHWMTVTGKNKDGSYNVNDPAGGNGNGRMIRMVVKDGRLQSADNQSKGSKDRTYYFDGNAVTFKGGNPQKGPETTGKTDSQTTTTQKTNTTSTQKTNETKSSSQVSTSLDPKRADDLSGNWQAKRGMNPNQYDSLIKESAAKYGVPPRLLKAMIQQESHFDPNAGSNKGARGLVQIMPGTWKDLGGGNPNDPKTNIDHSAKYMSQLLKRYQGDATKALAAYNWGMGHVDKLSQKGKPLNVSALPAETQGYVKNITASYEGRSYK